MGGSAPLKLPSGTPSHKVLKVKGKGVPRLHGSGRGDLLVRVIVEVPQKLTQKQRELLEAYASEGGESVNRKKGFVEKAKKLFGEE